MYTTLSNLECIPSCKGLYVFIVFDKIMYVGKSINLRRRISKNHKILEDIKVAYGGENVSVGYYKTDDVSTEWIFIRLLSPPFNMHFVKWSWFGKWNERVIKERTDMINRLLNLNK